MGLDSNIFAQIGFVVLIGLAATNAILVVEFAKQLEDSGMGRAEAIVEDRRTPVPDQVAFRIDFPAWLDTHPKRIGGYNNSGLSYCPGGLFFVAKLVS